MKPFVVVYTIKSVVMAEDEVHAHCVAEDVFRELARDESPDIVVDGEVRSAASLPYGWDLKCVPYGGDGNTRLESWVAAPKLGEQEGGNHG